MQLGINFFIFTVMHTDSSVFLQCQKTNCFFMKREKPILYSISFVLHYCISGSWDIEHLDSI